jgi:hypothetical protein
MASMNFERGEIKGKKKNFIEDNPPRDKQHASSFEEEDIVRNLMM